jgi:hypothetical protein
LCKHPAREVNLDAGNAVETDQPGKVQTTNFQKHSKRNKMLTKQGFDPRKNQRNHTTLKHFKVSLNQIKTFSIKRG